ncbi:hypothetical protein [Rathayibacter tritici]|uniref:hypothetical protein n=1 Tax=Rathayibacter tritici TaxID=33888 RepID=UPI0011B04067|nr:hypothetical protein [Rathayibacter tritici]
MAALNSTTPASAEGNSHGGTEIPFSISATPVRSSPLTLLALETDREARFWASYDMNPASTTAWADAAMIAWQSPAAAARAEKDLDRWNDEGGSDPF